MPARSGARRQGSFRAAVAPGGASFKGRYVSVMLPDGRTRLTRLTGPRAMLDGLVDGAKLRVEAGPVDHEFLVRYPEQARKTLAGCVDELKRAWGIDPSLEGRAASTLEGDPARYFGPEDYPPEAYFNGVYGRVVAFLNINETGAVVKCRIVQSAGQALNAGTCRTAMGMRFKPPRDKNGVPLASTYLLPVRWSLPGMPE